MPCVIIMTKSEYIRLEKLRWTSLQERRMRDDLIETFKIMEFLIMQDIFSIFLPRTGKSLSREISKSKSSN